jgi:phage protein D
MAINDPHDVPTVRTPRLRILNHGSVMGGALSFEVTQNNYFQADTFTARFSLNADPSYGINWWGAQQVQILLDIQASLDGGISWTSLVIGQVDHMAIHVDQGLCEVDGRDLTAYLIDQKTNETYQNKTSSQVAETLAQEHGLTADVTPTPTLVGRYYQIDHERIGAGDFTRTTTEWNLLCSLAQHENFDVWVTGTTLHFHPRVPIDTSDPYVVLWDAQNIASNAINLTVQRSMNFAKDIIVVVRSWNSSQSQSITKYAPSGARQAAIQAGTAAEYAFIFPNLTEAEAQAMANKIRADLSAHERLLEFERPADLTLSARTVITLQGTGSSWDTTYYADSVTREMSIERGFTMRVKAKNRDPEFESVLPTA